MNKRSSGGSFKEKDMDPAEDFKEEYYGLEDDKEKMPASPSIAHKGVTAQKSAPPLLKRRGRTVDVSSANESSTDPSPDRGSDAQKLQKLQTNVKSASVDSPSPNVESPPVPVRASGIYRRGVYVNNDDKSRQKFLQRNFRFDSKGSQGSVDSFDETYDNVVPVNREDGETSSDEEEPIYYNVLLMKQHSLHKVSTWSCNVGGGVLIPVSIGCEFVVSFKREGR